MRNFVMALMCSVAISAVAMPAAYSCENGKCPMTKAGKKCDHKNCKHCKEHAKKAKGHEGHQGHEGHEGHSH